jgi:hypothetical protein
MRLNNIGGCTVTKSKLVLVATIMSILVFLGISSAFSIAAYLSVSPQRIPQDGTVTIYVENRYETGPITVDYIEVEHDSGAIYTKSIGVVLNPGESITEYFGTGVSGWSPAADTSQDGKYVVTVYGPFTVNDYFNVSGMFAVPEFGLSMSLVTAIGFVLFLGLRGRTKKSVI